MLEIIYDKRSRQFSWKVAFEISLQLFAFRPAHRRHVIERYENICDIFVHIPLTKGMKKNNCFCIYVRTKVTSFRDFLAYILLTTADIIHKYMYINGGAITTNFDVLVNVRKWMKSFSRFPFICQKDTFCTLEKTFIFLGFLV